MSPENTFFASDLHFGHKNILRYNPTRLSVAQLPDGTGATVEQMNRGIVEQINSVVGPYGTLWELGDFSFLNDRDTQAIMESIFVQEVRMIFGNHCSRSRLTRLAESVNRARGYEQYVVVGDYAEIKLGNQDVVLSHYPMRDWNKAHYGAIQLHGHMHGALEPMGRSVDVGYDAPFITGKPCTIHSGTEVLAWAASRPVHEAGYHKRKET